MDAATGVPDPCRPCCALGQRCPPTSSSVSQRPGLLATRGLHHPCLGPTVPVETHLVDARDLAVHEAPQQVGRLIHGHAHHSWAVVCEILLQHLRLRVGCDLVWINKCQRVRGGERETLAPAAASQA